ncbi:2-phospho-L-lactate guanylyltransferase [Pseudovibrio axinellae]|uniref:2-phospho-L-lactate guanylyltransferase n=1 Tax=Pseudovibrio axinellae TaxID=989403 RepID=A0A165UM93_9HYPH|nr:2-phospho-L-lactate guanylyltransferase [Pseudovibrio axinellae]KZL12547.1 2-phospho-L-lactate guanylyltransferase [Pseudovibrio axinellae]SEP67477.1 2-phospho-L-lactate guanylyltransferase [Pseudovibrio axinellae]
MTEKLVKTLIVVPVKDFALAKSRLGPHLDAVERAKVAENLFAQTLSFLQEVQHRNRIAVDVAVVTSSEEIAERVGTGFAHLIREAQVAGLNSALATAADWASTHNYETLCVLPADIAAPDFEEFERILSLGGKPLSLTLCPSHDYGTNVLVVTPPNAITFTYGSASFLKHQKQAAERGLECIIAPSSSFSRDIDYMEDLTVAQPMLLTKLSERRAV